MFISPRFTCAHAARTTRLPTHSAYRPMSSKIRTSDEISPDDKVNAVLLDILRKLSIPLLPRDKILRAKQLPFRNYLKIEPNGNDSFKIKIEKIPNELSIPLQGYEISSDLIFRLFLLPVNLDERAKEKVLIQFVTKMEDKFVNQTENANQKDKPFKSSLTLLHYAVILNYAELTQVLLDKGGNPFLQNQLGISAYQIALFLGDKKLISILNPKANVEKELSCLNMKFLNYVRDTFTNIANLREDSNFCSLVEDILHDRRLEMTLQRSE